MVGGRDGQERPNPPAPGSPLWLPSLSHPRSGQLSPGSSIPRTRDVPVAGTLKLNPAELYRVENLTAQSLPLPAFSSQRVKVSRCNRCWYTRCSTLEAMCRPSNRTLATLSMRNVQCLQGSHIPKLPNIDSSLRRSNGSPAVRSPQQHVEQQQQQSPSKRLRGGSPADPAVTAASCSTSSLTDPAEGRCSLLVIGPLAVHLWAIGHQLYVVSLSGHITQPATYAHLIQYTMQSMHQHKPSALPRECTAVWRLQHLAPCRGAHVLQVAPEPAASASSKQMKQRCSPCRKTRAVTMIGVLSLNQMGRQGRQQQLKQHRRLCKLHITLI